MVIILLTSLNNILNYVAPQPIPSIFWLPSFFLSLFIDFEREKERGQRGKERESQADSMHSAKLNIGLYLMNREIMT